MPGIRFSELADKFIDALETAGATVLVHGVRGERPLALSVVSEGAAVRLEVYLWAVTFGGRGRGRPDERRIQLTNVDRFVLKGGVRTILGGWSEEEGVFAFWDVRRHLGFSAGSPSLQISVHTLQRARTVGFATELRDVREGQETAIAVYPDYLLWYIREYERLYDCGYEAIDAVNLIDAEPESERQFIDSGRSDVEQSRRHQVVSVVRNFREARFRPTVLRAYGYRCCLTGVALRLVDAAHVIPVSDPTSTDEPRNGVALNPLLHRAYDAGLLGLLPRGKTALNLRFIDALQRHRRDAGLDLVRGLIPSEMTMPSSREFIPPDDYFLRGLRARGWTDDDIAAAS